MSSLLGRRTELVSRDFRWYFITASDSNRLTQEYQIYLSNVTRDRFPFLCCRPFSGNRYSLSTLKLPISYLSVYLYTSVPLCPLWFPKKP